MAVVKNSNPHGQLDSIRLAAFEDRLGVTLPPDYRQFLLAHNGAELAPDEIILPGQTEPFASLGTVFGLHGGPESLDKVFGNVEGEIPAELVAFAEDVGGNLLCIGIRSEHRGKVYFWDHGRSTPGDDEPGWDNITLLAGSFEPFLAALGGPQPGT
jgi:hypothetical protein